MNLILFLILNVLLNKISINHLREWIFHLIFGLYNHVQVHQSPCDDLQIQEHYLVKINRNTAISQFTVIDLFLQLYLLIVFFSYSYTSWYHFTQCWIYEFSKVFSNIFNKASFEIVFVETWKISLEIWAFLKSH